MTFVALQLWFMFLVLLNVAAVLATPNMHHWGNYFSMVVSLAAAVYVFVRENYGRSSMFGVIKNYAKFEVKNGRVSKVEIKMTGGSPAQAVARLREIADKIEAESK